MILDYLREIYRCNNLALCFSHMQKELSIYSRNFSVNLQIISLMFTSSYTRMNINPLEISIKNVSLSLHIGTMEQSYPLIK